MLFLVRIQKLLTPFLSTTSLCVSDLIKDWLTSRYFLSISAWTYRGYVPLYFKERAWNVGFKYRPSNFLWGCNREKVTGARKRLQGGFFIIRHLTTADKVWKKVTVTRRYAPAHPEETSSPLPSPIVVTKPLFPGFDVLDENETSW